jgi:hypothetical protein
MLYQITRFLPFFLAGFLVLNLLTATLDGGRANWLLVAVLASLLAVTVFQRTRATPTDRRAYAVPGRRGGAWREHAPGRPRPRR